jgi:hypothetical protein
LFPADGFSSPDGACEALDGGVEDIVSAVLQAVEANSTMPIKANHLHNALRSAAPLVPCGPGGLFLRFIAIPLSIRRHGWFIIDLLILWSFRFPLEIGLL